MWHVDTIAIFGAIWVTVRTSTAIHTLLLLLWLYVLRCPCQSSNRDICDQSSNHDIITSHALASSLLTLLQYIQWAYLHDYQIQCEKTTINPPIKSAPKYMGQEVNQNKHVKVKRTTKLSHIKNKRHSRDNWLCHTSADLSISSLWVFHISTKWLRMSTLLNQYWSSYTCYRVVEWFCRWRFNVSPKQLEWMCVCSMEGIFLLCIGHQTLTQHRKAKSKHGIALRLTMYTSYGIFYVTLRTGFGTRTFIKTAWL